MAYGYKERDFPSLAVLLDAQPASFDGIAAYLGISPRSLARYKTANFAPKSVVLALFYGSNYGRSLINASAHNSAMWAAGENAGLKVELAKLKTELAKTQKSPNQGAFCAAANDCDFNQQTILLFS